MIEDSANHIIQLYSVLKSLINLLVVDRPVVDGVMGCDQKSFKIVWRCHQLLSRFLAKGHLLQASRQSRLSASDKGDNELMLRFMHRYPGIYLMVQENPGKPQLGDRLMRAMGPLIASNEVFFSSK